MNKTKINWGIEPVPCYEGYWANRNGKIIGPRGKILKPTKGRYNHLYVFMKGKKRWLHQVILETFIGPKLKGMVTRHLNENALDNRLENLTWGTYQENSDDRKKHGTMPIPHESIFTKLIPEHIPLIRIGFRLGKSSRVLAMEFETSHTTIQKIINGKRWKGY